MTPFLGTFQNRLDAKGRVSVPAPFRAALRGAEQAGGLILRPSHKHACIEAWPAEVFNALAQKLAGMDLFSDAHETMAAILYSDSYPVEADKEGRVLLPEDMVAHAGLTDSVTFLGFGKIFQIWEPAAAAAFKAALRVRGKADGVLRATQAGTQTGTQAEVGA